MKCSCCIFAIKDICGHIVDCGGDCQDIEDMLVESYLAKEITIKEFLRNFNNEEEATAAISRYEDRKNDRKDL